MTTAETDALTAELQYRSANRFAQDAGGDLADAKRRLAEAQATMRTYSTMSPAYQAAVDLARHIKEEIYGLEKNAYKVGGRDSFSPAMDEVVRQFSGDAEPKDQEGSRYNAEAVQKAIESSNRAGRRIGGQEAKLIHSLLKGRDQAMATDPPVSEAQRRAMQAAAHGNSDLGIPEKVGKEFVGKDASRATITIVGGRWFYMADGVRYGPYGDATAAAEAGRAAGYATDQAQDADTSAIQIKRDGRDPADIARAYGVSIEEVYRIKNAPLGQSGGVGSPSFQAAKKAAWRTANE
jgi:hypothetical protein